MAEPTPSAGDASHSPRAALASAFDLHGRVAVITGGYGVLRGSIAGALAAARAELIGRWGRVDILVNAAGGNVARARTDPTSVFDVPLDAFDEVVELARKHGAALWLCSDAASFVTGVVVPVDGGFSAFSGV
jgi:NAD(P)-dependent dehydrogenase (short-subunit alcohol dehydrogenase family)